MRLVRFLFAFLIALCHVVSAQNIMRIHYNDGKKTDVPISLVDSITFEESATQSTRIMIVPDIQHYTDNDANLPYLDVITDYYINQIDSFSACFQVGDVTNNNMDWQWENAFNHFFKKFPMGKEPYFCMGNHDYGENGKSGTRTSNIPEYMKPVMEFQMKGCQYENYVRYLQVGEVNYAVLDLEFAPRNNAIEWANNIIAANPSTPFILLTHVFLNRYAQIYDATDPSCFSKGSQKTYVMGGDYVNDSKEIFDKLIYDNPNIKLVVCGHSLTPNYIDVVEKTNAAGENVHIVMVNYQHYDEGGKGYVGIMDFEKEGYRIRSFSTVSKKFCSIDISVGGN